METVANFSFVVRAGGRSVSDDGWQEINPAHIAVWKTAVTLLRERRVVAGGIAYSVTMDWTPLLRRHERHHAALVYLYKHGSKEFERRIRKARFPRRLSKISVTVRSSAKKVTSLQSVAESVLHDVFLIMNIAAPGCCDFYRSDIVGKDSKAEVSLSGYIFEIHLLINLDKKWPPSRIIALEKVISWYDSVRSGVAQLPSSSTERTLFAILHLAKLDGDAMAIIWLFYAFESLLQTKSGENFTAIVRRLSLLLGAAPDKVAIIKKALRKLYDIRSAIVHGGFEVAHPMNNEALDKRAQKAFDDLVSTADYGYALIIAAIQNMVENGWPQLRFEENISS